MDRACRVKILCFTYQIENFCKQLTKCNQYTLHLACFQQYQKLVRECYLLKTKKSWEMCAEHNTSGTSALLLSINFKLGNNFMKNTGNANILHCPFPYLHNTQSEISPCLSNRLATDHH